MDRHELEILHVGPSHMANTCSHAGRCSENRRQAGNNQIVLEEGVLKRVLTTQFTSRLVYDAVKFPRAFPQWKTRGICGLCGLLCDPTSIQALRTVYLVRRQVDANISSVPVPKLSCRPAVLASC